MQDREQTPKVVEGGITAVPGFTAAGLSAGVKKNRRLDLAMIFSDKPCSVAGVFTRNRFLAPPLVLDKKHLKKGLGQAIIANSGNANAFTGGQGYQDARAMAETSAQTLGIPVSSVYVASTGVISEFLPTEKILRAIPDLAASLSPRGSHAASEAIMTTDTFSKEVALVGNVGRSYIRVGGIAKGSGMIHPNMATMLAFLSTDAMIEADLLQESLRQAVDRSFHQITVDGDTSTNDMVLLFANGKSGERINKSKRKTFHQFTEILEAACLSLAKKIVEDGEGATKRIEIHVVQAQNNKAARQIAMTIARSSLVKTAFFGEDANWGRIVAAIGNAGVPVHPKKIGLDFGGIPLVREGTYLGEEAESRITSYLKKKEVCLTLSLNSGGGESTVWTSDLSLEYVKINALYRS